MSPRSGPRRSTDPGRQPPGNVPGSLRPDPRGSNETMSYDARRLVNRLAASMRKSTPNSPGPPGFTTIKPAPGWCVCGEPSDRDGDRRAAGIRVVEWHRERRALEPGGTGAIVKGERRDRQEREPRQMQGWRVCPGLVREFGRRGRCERGASTPGRGAGGCLSEGKPRPHSGSHQGNAILSADAHAARAPRLLVTTERDTWNPTQYERFRSEREQPFHDLAALHGRRPARRVVDLGCGTGVLTAALHDQLGATETVGVNSSEAMLERGRALDAPGVRFVHGDIAEWAPDQPVDVVFSNAALQWLPDHPQLFKRLTTMLVPGGELAGSRCQQLRPCLTRAGVRYRTGGAVRRRVGRVQAHVLRARARGVRNTLPQPWVRRAAGAPAGLRPCARCEPTPSWNG